MQRIQQQSAYKKPPSKICHWLGSRSFVMSFSWLWRGKGNYCTGLILLRPQFRYETTRRGKTNPLSTKNQSQKLIHWRDHRAVTSFPSLRNPLIGNWLKHSRMQGSDRRYQHYKRRDQKPTNQTFSWNGQAETGGNGVRLTCRPVLSMWTRTASRSLRAPVPTTSAV